MSLKIITTATALSEADRLVLEARPGQLVTTKARWEDKSTNLKFVFSMIGESRVPMSQLIETVSFWKASSNAAYPNLEALKSDPDYRDSTIEYTISAENKSISGTIELDIVFSAPGSRSAVYEIQLEATDTSNTGPNQRAPAVTWQLVASTPSVAAGPSQPVTLERTRGFLTEDLPLWIIIRRSTERGSFNQYQYFVNLLLCGGDADSAKEFSGLSPRDQTMFRSFSQRYGKNRRRRFLPFNDTDAYRFLKVASEAFVLASVASPIHPGEFASEDVQDLLRRNGISASSNELEAFWSQYLTKVNGDPGFALPYLASVAQRFDDLELKDAIFSGLDPKSTDNLDCGGERAEIRRDAQGNQNAPEFESPAPIAHRCYGVLREKLTRPVMLELIWSYWHEEGMQAQSMIALRNRFQNVRSPGPVDPLASMELDALRPLNNILWGYIQDEQHRLTLMRRNYEYDHHYGFGLQGSAVPPLRSADSRSKFLEAFHNLMYLNTGFFKDDDDTTRIADGFPILNAIKEVHFLLAEGAHNQFGDLPSTSRQEMLLEQWILARPEFREFLPARTMVAYSEPWMASVDSMKNLQGWTATSVMYFHDLAKYGEQLLLSIRYGAWSSISDPQNAANWARYWRAEIQGYIHSYRTVTGVDLSLEPSDPRQAEIRNMAPSAHLVRQMQQQRNLGRGPIGTRGTPSPTAGRWARPRS